MCDALVHRGPDEDGYLFGPHVALGMRRLSIIDVDSGAQPIYNEDATVAVVFNGEIYNAPELRAGLESRGHRFATATDTECIVHCYEEMGEACVEALRGMFAFALWDGRSGRLLLARDRVGKKPLYYRLVAGGIWFASELKALLQDPALPRRVDPVAMHHYLSLGYVPAPRAMLQGVAKLPPASTLAFQLQDASATVRRYWRLAYQPKQAIEPAEAAEELRNLIREATRIRLASERPLGAFLSGGVDSSVVVAAMAEQLAQPVKTFSIGFEDQRFDERRYARMVAERFGTTHEELVVSPKASDIEGLLPRLTWHYDEPFADSSAIPSFYLAEMARRQVVVALNGDGGDESFGGYQRYLAARVAARLPGGQTVSRLGLRAVAALPDGQHRSQLRRAKRFLGFALSPPAERYAGLMAVFSRAELETLYQPEWAAALEEDQREGPGEVADPIAEAFAAAQATDPAEAAMEVDVNTYLPGDLLVKVDIATMAHSLEARCPLLDHRLMEFAASLPADYKLRGSTGKWILKEAARGWVPDAVLDRPKMGFGVPVAAWLRTDLRPLVRDLLTDATARNRGWFQPAAVDRLLAEHDAGADHGARIWALLRNEAWHRMFVDQPRAVAPAGVAGTGPAAGL